MAKFKILVIPSDKWGVGKFRSIDQHVRLQELYPDDYSITISNDFDFFNDNSFLTYDLIHIHKVPYNLFDKSDEILSLIRSHGIPYIIDIDDYWRLSIKHPQYASYANGDRSRAVVNAIRTAKYVTTTTPFLAKEISKINMNVLVLPNAINPNEKQMRITPTKNDFDLRIGWLGGAAHAEDILLLDGLFSRINGLSPKIQTVLCGFDKRGFKRVINQKTQKVEVVNMEINELDYYKYEQVMTNRFRNLEDDPEYAKQLLKYEPLKIDDTNKTYRRIWTKDIKEYLTGYNEFDVALAPLCEHDYNKMKSQLKVIEAGFFKKAVIAQNFGPYTLDIVNGKNGLLVDSSRNHKDWFKKVKLLNENPNMVIDLGESLYETVSNKYHIDTVTKMRHEFYQTLK